MTKTRTMTVLLLLFDWRNELLWDSTRHQRMKKKDLGLGKTNDKNKEEVESSGEEDEDEDGSPNTIK